MITVAQARASVWPLAVRGGGRGQSSWLYYCEADPRLGRLDIVCRLTGQCQSIWHAIGDERGFGSLEEAVAVLARIPEAEAA